MSSSDNSNPVYDLLKKHLPAARFEDAKAALRLLISYIGENPDRPGLEETPDRIVRSWTTLFSGYGFTDEAVGKMLKEFDHNRPDEMVILSNVEFYSTCEHHMLPFYGTASIAYIPDMNRKKVVGISKLARLLEVYSRRMNTQENICQQVTGALMDHLNPLGAACVLKAKHFCMCARGVNKQHSVLTTSSMRGVFRTRPEVRAEFFSCTAQAVNS